MPRPWQKSNMAAKIFHKSRHVDRPFLDRRRNNVTTHRLVFRSAFCHSKFPPKIAVRSDEVRSLAAISSLRGPFRFRRDPRGRSHLGYRIHQYWGESLDKRVAIRPARGYRGAADSTFDRPAARIADGWRFQQPQSRSCLPPSPDGKVRYIIIRLFFNYIAGRGICCPEELHDILFQTRVRSEAPDCSAHHYDGSKYSLSTDSRNLFDAVISRLRL